MSVSFHSRSCRPFRLFRQNTFNVLEFMYLVQPSRSVDMIVCICGNMCENAGVNA